MLDNQTREIIKKRDERILKNLSIAKERNRGLEENTLGRIFLENKRRDRELKNLEKSLIYDNKILKNMKYKIMEQDKFKK